MSSDLNYFRSLNWNSTVSLELSVRKDGLSVLDTVYFTAYRNSYPFFIYQQLKYAFLQSNHSSNQLNSINDDDIWFEVVDLPESNTSANNIPDKLKLHWNIGLSYDYYTFNYNPLKNHAPPLKLILHLSNSADSAAAHLQSTKLSFMGSLKESQLIYWGTVKRITQLKTNQTEQLWHSIQSNDIDEYFKIADKLLPLPLSIKEKEMDDNETPKPRSIPLKFILPDQILAYPVLHGTAIPLEADISWLASTMASPDGFLRFCIILN
ncbi:hypothetical protein E3P89_01116 [Wallemia ichthyophaga]|uniref:Autophagy protein 5 n=1 Tax=Wallemia ichthyophaga TaxID=245174 RepID=A0A4T0HHZ6_WALIC|nr:hypothetical protein E3P90_01517 [Wallemia ichthyophaga]TIB15576.1 hypothetical protein E3P93_01267 [Wallemia ichthyophaga]TIB24250.1 hypothetical protein E3P89_01116 [Wallemia ichthyophaga]TIB25583.1 hypothetical protein E3P88_01471 [Wallemia ichthyophaga]